MAYSSNPNLPRARAIAMQLLVSKRLPLQVVANKCGVHRCTIWRWKQKWEALNAQVQLTNDNRPTREAGSVFRLAGCTWRIPTLVSAPHTRPHAIGEQVVARITRATSPTQTLCRGCLVLHHPHRRHCRQPQQREANTPATSLLRRRQEETGAARQPQAPGCHQAW